MNRVKQIEDEIEALKNAIKHKEDELFEAKTPIKARLKRLDDEQRLVNTKFSKRRKEILRSCDHDWRKYTYEYDNYDRDVDHRVVCTNCGTDLRSSDLEEWLKNLEREE